MEPTSEDYKAAVEFLRREIKATDERIESLFNEGVRLSKERDLYKEGLEVSDKDCLDSREQIVALKAEIAEYEKVIKEVKLDSARIHELSGRQAEEIERLKDELECYKLSPSEASKLITGWQKRSFEFEEENKRLRDALEDIIAGAHCYNTLDVAIAEKALKQVEEDISYEPKSA